MAKVIRVLIYEGPEDILKDAMGRSLADGIHIKNALPSSLYTIEVKTCYSDLETLVPQETIDYIAEKIEEKSAHPDQKD